ncbi:MAG: MFS transporter, partial [Proteobacteria bacterium]|nr:MFS transporter [Pseudomonadota bacterium]
KKVITDAGEVPADIVLIAVGVRPNIRLAKETGLEIGKTGAIAVDHHMRTSDPDIYAGGDCVENNNLVTGKPLYVPMGSTANKHGRVIGDNICGIPTEFKGVLGTAICKVFHMNVARTGLSEIQAKNEGYDYITVLNPAPDKPHFIPGAKLIILKFIVDKKTGKLLGAQMVGPVAMAYVADLTPVGREGHYMGLLNIAIFTGFGSGPLIGGFCNDHWGMASAFYVMASLSFLAMMLIMVQMPAAPPSPAKTERGPGVIKSLRTMLASHRTTGILLARMATMIVMVPTMALLPLLMHQWFQATGMQIGMVIAARTLVNAVLQHPCGRLADRMDKVKLLQIGCLVISGVMCLVPLAGNFWVLLGLFVILGSGEAIIWPTLGALATEEGRSYGQGSMMGAFNLAMSSGVFIGAIGAGFISDWLGLSWSFLLIGILVFGLSLVATRLINR